MSEDTFSVYDSKYLELFYNQYPDGGARLDRTAYGRLQTIIHEDYLRRYLRSGELVLDAGCGSGRFSLTAASLGANLILLDIAQRQLDMAIERLKKANLSTQVKGAIRADITDLSALDDNSVDDIVCYGGPLSYVCDDRQQAVSELLRVTRPGGIILISVMSRFGVVVNVVRQVNRTMLRKPSIKNLWNALYDGILERFPSEDSSLQHPQMYLYTSEELKSLFSQCEILEVAGCNVTTYEGCSDFDNLDSEHDVWREIVQLERTINEIPGLLDTGSHIIMAVRVEKDTHNNLPRT